MVFYDLLCCWMYAVIFVNVVEVAESKTNFSLNKVYSILFYCKLGYLVYTSHYPGHWGNILVS